MANDKDPLRVFVLEIAGYVGGFSPGRTFGPVVATVGVGLAEVLEGAGLDTGDVELGGTVECGADVVPPGPLLVHATAPSKIRAISAIPLLHTA